MHKLILAAAALAAAIGFARAADTPQTATVLRSCPAQGWHRACVPIAFFYSDDGADRLRFKTVEESNSPYPIKVQHHLVVTAAFTESAGNGAFLLMLGNNPVSENEADSPNELGAFAFVGRSRAGRPVILTDRGPLEILTKSVDFESSGDLYVVREKIRRVTTKLIAGYGLPFVATKRGDIGIWDAARGICIEAPTRTTRELRLITTACKDAGAAEAGTTIGGNATEATDIDDATAMKIIGEDPPGLGTYRAPGTGLLLIWVSWQYCC